MWRELGSNSRRLDHDAFPLHHTCRQIDFSIVDLPSKIEESYTFNSKPLWHSAKDADIEAYKRTLDGRLKLCTLNSCIISNSMPCVCDVSHVDAISNFHNYIIDACKIAMTVHISSLV